MVVVTHAHTRDQIAKMGGDPAAITTADPRVPAIEQWLEEAMVRLNCPKTGINRLLDLLDEAADSQDSTRRLAK